MAARQTPRPRDYRGPSGGLKVDSPWLSSEDLPQGADIPVTIEKVVQYDKVTFDAGREVKGVGGLQFQGKAKVLLLTASINRKTMVAMFGSDTSAWWGQSITLYIDPDSRIPGGTGPAIRIRNKRAAAAHARANAPLSRPTDTPQDPAHLDEPPGDYKLEGSE